MLLCTEAARCGFFLACLLLLRKQSVSLHCTIVLARICFFIILLIGWLLSVVAAFLNHRNNFMVTGDYCSYLHVYVHVSAQDYVISDAPAVHLCTCVGVSFLLLLLLLFIYCAWSSPHDSMPTSLVPTHQCRKYDTSEFVDGTLSSLLLLLFWRTLRTTTSYSRSSDACL